MLSLSLLFHFLWRIKTNFKKFFFHRTNTVKKFFFFLSRKKILILLNLLTTKTNKQTNVRAAKWKWKIEKKIWNANHMFLVVVVPKCTGYLNFISCQRPPIFPPTHIHLLLSSYRFWSFHFILFYVFQIQNKTNKKK